jgi:hypothetical protein
LANTGWTDEARAASLEVRRANPPSLGSYGGTPRRLPFGTGAPGGVLRNTGWTDEARAASLAVRRAKAAARKAARERMFQEQRERGGRDFIENWFPRGEDGKEEDPHYGVSTREAPYGYVDGTDRPRKEPLYDAHGRPIVPKSWEEWNRPAKSGVWPFQKDVSAERDVAWLKKVRKAEEYWGPFGQKKRFFDRNPGATEKDWQKYERKQYEEWKKEQRELEGKPPGVKGKSKKGDGEEEEEDGE